MKLRINQIIIVFAALIVSLLLISQAISGQGNSIGYMSKFLCIASFFIGLFMSRAGVVLLIFYACYIDMLKRFMVLDYSLGIVDVAWVLSVPIALVAGLVAGRFLTLWFGQGRLNRWEWISLVLAGIGSVVAVGIVVKSGFELREVQTAANLGIYSFLPFICLNAIDSDRALQKYLNAVILIMIPSALYGIWQWVYGLSPFEIDYLLSGLTTNVRLLDDVAPRPFSTVANPAGFASLCTVGLSFCALKIIKAKKASKNHGVMIICTLAALVFLIALIGTRVRSSWVACIVLFILWISYQRKWTMVSIYMLIFSALATVIGFSGYMLENKILEKGANQIVDAMGGGEFAHQAGRIHTFAERLKGYRDVLSNPDDWPLFGESDLVLGEDIVYHDQISSMIYTIGAIPTFSIILIVIFLGVKVHQLLLKYTTVGIERISATCFLAVSLSFMLSGVVGGGGIRVYPICIYFYLGVSLCMCVMRMSKLNDVRYE